VQVFVQKLVLLLTVLLTLPAPAFCDWTWLPPGECPTEYWELEEQWRLGPDSDPLIYGTTVLESDAEGRIYLLNAILPQLQIYDAQGNFLRSILSKGEGPGEVTTPLDFCFTADGDLCVMQGFPAKLVIIDRDGNYVNAVRPREKDREPEPFSILQALVQGGSKLLIGESLTNYGTPGSVETVERVWLLDGSFMYEKKIFEKRRKYNLEQYDLLEKDLFIRLWNRLAMDNRGRIFNTPQWVGYRIVRRDPSGQESTFITADYPSLERTKETKQKIREDLEKSSLAEGHPPQAVHVEETWPDIISLYTQQDGTLWVLSSRGFHVRGEGEIYSYDVFDHEGAFVKKVSLRGPGWNEYPAVYFLEKNTILLYTQAYDYEGSEGEEGEIICCKVARRYSETK
jgi:hypothetical protein